MFNRYIQAYSKEFSIENGAGVHYLYRSFGKKELSVCEYLTVRGQDVFLPTLDGSPLFPSYMFVNEDGIDFYELNRTPGGIGVVVFGDMPAMVPESIIDSLKNTEWQRSEECAPGTRVIVNTGAFNHIEAIVKAKKADRIIVLMTIMQQEQELEFSTKDVVAA